MFSWLNGYSPSFSTKVTRCSNPTHPPSKQFFVFLRFFRLESNISPYFSPFHAKFFQRGREVNSQRRSSIEEQEKREKCVFRGISRTSKEGEVVEKREVNGGGIEEKKRRSIRNRISRHVLSISGISWKSSTTTRSRENDISLRTTSFDER